MCKYLYLDDADETTCKALATSLSGHGLTIDYLHVSELKLEDKQKLSSTLNHYDGLLLDLRLDENPRSGGNGEVSSFTATEYAQHIRTMITNERLQKDLPIVLFSTDAKLKKVYSVDLTSQDLFDRYIEKSRMPIDATTKLISLAKGYRTISQQKDIKTLLGIASLDDIDGRIYARFISSNSLTLEIPAHEYAQMILKNLIYITGPLINEDILAARLGVDKNQNDWQILLHYFNNAKYTGVFSDGWDRWWMYDVDNRFYSLAKTHLSFLDANERVALLNQLFHLKLVPAKPINENHSNRFWTICKILKQPIDPIEGFRIYSPIEPKNYQEYEYGSLLAFLTKKNEEAGIFVHPSDNERLNVRLSEYS